jgi:hypothetical protein
LEFDDLAYPMTPDAILQAVDLTDTAASVIPSGRVAKTVLRSTRLFWAMRREQRFMVLIKVSVGPKGGVYGHVYLRDMEITPAVDSIRVGEVPDFSSHQLLSLNELFWKDGEKLIPEEPVIFEFLKQKVTELPIDIGFYEDCFARGYFDTPANSIHGLQGGAPGLGS